MIRKLLVSSALAGIAFASPAAAAKFVFTSAAFDLTFELPDSPVVKESNPGHAFTVIGSGILDGNPIAFDKMIFLSMGYTSAFGIFGGFSYDASSAAAFTGIQLYSGPEATPRFVAGTYVLTQYGTGAPGTLIISDVAVPEPMTWALMVGGFGLVGGAMRRTAARVAVARA